VRWGPQSESASPGLRPFVAGVRQHWHLPDPAGILLSVRWSWLIPALALAAAAPAHARRTPEQQAAAAEQAGDFWRDVVEPHADQVRGLLEKAKHAMSEPEKGITSDSDWAVEQRTKFFRDAYNLLRYARTLAPENIEVLTNLGRAADEIGKTHEAIEALEAAARIAGPDKVGADVTGQLGAIYLRLGNYDAAVRWLRLAQGPATPLNAAALVYLASALSARGEVVSAIDTLQNALPSGTLGYYDQNLAVVTFALAVVYDRDEQRSSAFDTLDRLQALMQQQYANNMLQALARLRFAPADDRHYFQALLYESIGHYTEARAEWALYAAAGDTPWRGRALDHIAAIDAERRAAPGGRPAPGPSPFPPIRRPRP
jgi:tetratricopeptide (TPR) repeat protein